MISHNIANSRIIFPEKDLVRARRVIFISNFGHTYKFSSIKCGRMLYLESGIERDWATILEFDSRVIIFSEQPFRIEYIDEDGNLLSMFPDFIVYYDDGSVVVVEVKPAPIAAKKEIKQKFDLEKQILAHHGYEFKVVTDDEMRSGLQLKNSKMLRPYRRTLVSSIHCTEVLEALRISDMTERKLIDRVYGLTRDNLLSMLAKSIIATDLSLPLNSNTLYSHPKRQSKLLQQQLRAFETRCV